MLFENVSKKVKVNLSFGERTVLHFVNWISIQETSLTLFHRGCRFRPTPGGGAGIWYPPLEIKEGVVLGPMLQKVILKPIKVMITCKIWGPYLKNSARYQDLKNLRWRNLSHIDPGELPQLIFLSKNWNSNFCPKYIFFLLYLGKV